MSDNKKGFFRWMFSNKWYYIIPTVKIGLWILFSYILGGADKVMKITGLTWFLDVIGLTFWINETEQGFSFVQNLTSYSWFSYAFIIALIVLVYLLWQIPFLIYWLFKFRKRN